ncbi:hypothetical protein KR50_34310 [Jeotgalibacillus campisalis]|uniref:Uncharacterized protein n=1 Tax=Jeotgalibacillus campisalis TaxID=220754 RepID=A0A0C2VGC8_9BACL|nr:hypothetical protein KR50_34310 [Jeotgalibacillus campisalis]
MADSESDYQEITVILAKGGRLFLFLADDQGNNQGEDTDR